MDVTYKWLLPNQVLYASMAGVVTAAHISSINQQVVHYITQAQPHAIFIVFNMSRVTRLSFEPNAILQHTSYYRHPYFRGQIGYGLSPAVRAYVRALNETMNRMSRRHYHLCDSYADVVSYLRRHQVVLPDHRPQLEQ